MKADIRIIKNYVDNLNEAALKEAVIQLMAYGDGARTFLLEAAYEMEKFYKFIPNNNPKRMEI